jgi:hypothetical protein
MPDTKVKIVMADSPEAATRRTVTGWVSRDGFFFGDDERLARYKGCTHVKCSDCGSVIEKTRLICGACCSKRTAAKFEKLPKKEWDGETPLALFDGDRFFFDEDDIDMYCEDVEAKRSDLKLVFCVPCKPCIMSANDMFADELPEDGSIDDPDILAAVTALNAAIRKAEPFSWFPGSVAAIIDPEPAAESAK